MKKGVFKKTTIVSVIIITIVGLLLVITGKIRLDQYATTILASTAGVVGSMFGLTAASYAFIWADLRSDRQENRHLGKVLNFYSKRLWIYFSHSLVFTVLVIMTSLIGLALAQNITEPTLSALGFEDRNIITRYINNCFRGISGCTLINLELSIIAVLFMARMNWLIFRRDFQYSRIAGMILKTIQQKYNMEVFDKNECNKEDESYIWGSTEYEKIHNLEILIERIMKNHESIGDAFAESQRREKLLSAIITNELKKSYELENSNENFISENIVWDYLEEKKRNCRWNMCREKAKTEIDFICNRENETFIENVNRQKKPCDCDFISVYDDLLAYRDNSLVKQEHYSKKSVSKESHTEKTMGIYEQRALRYTIKKRLLIFYLRGEMFSNMDLSGVSFSGADLRGTNFSDCNLTGIRLKGTNCKGADFTRSRMTGMYFADVERSLSDKCGEIQLSCRDISSDNGWDPYIGREITCLENATFKEADVSRTYLRVPGKLKECENFPYNKETVWKLDDKYEFFSLRGTNFDYAKMFFSYFKNVDFTNSSLEKAQMYNTGLVQVSAKAANFAATTLTNACIAWCNFENADFSNASLVETIVLRTNFRGANMKNVNFASSNIVSCNFEGASCQNASFKNMVQHLSDVENMKIDALEGIELASDLGLSFDYATLTDTDFSGAELNGASFSYAVGQKCIFTKTVGKKIKFDNAIFNLSVFNSDKFEDVSLRNTIIQNAVFTDVKFINSVFNKTDLSGSIFNVTDEEIFVGGYMQKADFSNVKGLVASNFRNIYLDSVNFTGTGIKKENFDSSVKVNNCKF